jgi:tubulin polyglutamylase TTLL6/13
VVQKYIKNPFLIDGYKFDLRIYVLVTCIDPLTIFIYREGLARFATEKYSLEKGQFDNAYIHLTNYAINKQNERFNEEEDGSKRKLSDILPLLDKAGIPSDKVITDIDDAIVKTLISIQPNLSHNYKSFFPSDLEGSLCFELLGFDILIDKKGKVWVLEVNMAPSFNSDTGTDKDVKPEMFSEMFKLINMTKKEKQRKLEMRKRLSMK